MCLRTGPAGSREAAPVPARPSVPCGRAPGTPSQPHLDDAAPCAPLLGQKGLGQPQHLPQPVQHHRLQLRARRARRLREEHRQLPSASRPPHRGTPGQGGSVPARPPLSRATGRLSSCRRAIPRGACASHGGAPGRGRGRDGSQDRAAQALPPGGVPGPLWAPSTPVSALGDGGRLARPNPRSAQEAMCLCARASPPHSWRYRPSPFSASGLGGLVYAQLQGVTRQGTRLKIVQPQARPAGLRG